MLGPKRAERKHGGVPALFRNSRITFPSTRSTSVCSWTLPWSLCFPAPIPVKPAWSRLFLSLELGSEGCSVTDRLRLTNGGHSMATPGEPCTGLRVSPICPTPFSGPELLGKAVADFKFLTSGSSKASEQPGDRSNPFHQTRALAEPLPATGDFVICIKLVDWTSNLPIFTFLLSPPYIILWPGVQQVRARLAVKRWCSQRAGSVFSTTLQHNCLGDFRQHSGEILLFLLDREGHRIDSVTSCLYGCKWGSSLLVPQSTGL